MSKLLRVHVLTTGGTAFFDNSEEGLKKAKDFCTVLARYYVDSDHMNLLQFVAVERISAGLCESIPKEIDYKGQFTESEIVYSIFVDKQDSVPIEKKK